jgi:hypothetical protein
LNDPAQAGLLTAPGTPHIPSGVEQGHSSELEVDMAMGFIDVAVPFIVLTLFLLFLCHQRLAKKDGKTFYTRYFGWIARESE